MASEPRNWSETADQTVGGHRFLTWATTQVKTAWKLLEYSSAYLAVLAALEVLMVQLLLALPLSPAPVVVGLATFSIYANDRLIDLSSDEVSNPQRTAFARRYQSILQVFAALAYGGAVALSILGGPVAFGLALIPGVAWVVYAVDWVPTSGSPFQRLKEIIVVNSAIVAGAWSLTIVFLPIAFAGNPITPEALVIFSYLTLGTFVTAEISNVRDIESDIESGVATLPVALGVRGTRHVLTGIVGLIAGMVVLAAIGTSLTVIEAGALLLGLASLLTLVSLVDRTDRFNVLSVAGEFTRIPVLATLLVAGYLL